MVMVMSNGAAHAISIIIETDEPPMQWRRRESTLQHNISSRLYFKSNVVTLLPEDGDLRPCMLPLQCSLCFLCFPYRREGGRRGGGEGGREGRSSR